MSPDWPTQALASPVEKQLGTPSSSQPVHWRGDHKKDVVCHMLTPSKKQQKEATESRGSQRRLHVHGTFLNTWLKGIRNSNHQLLVGMIPQLLNRKLCSQGTPGWRCHNRQPHHKRTAQSPVSDLVCKDCHSAGCVTASGTISK